METLKIRQFIEYETACEILRAASCFFKTTKRQIRKDVTEEYKQRQKIRAEKMLEEWKKNCVPPNVFQRLNKTTITEFSLRMAGTNNQLYMKSTHNSLSNEIDGNSIIALKIIFNSELCLSYFIFMNNRDFRRKVQSQ